MTTPLASHGRAAAIAMATLIVVGSALTYAWHHSYPKSRVQSTRVSRSFRREQQREVRRHQKDMALRRRKQEKALERERHEAQMTEEQKREKIERVKMQRVEQYQKLDEGRAHGLRVVVDLEFVATHTQRECNSIFKQLGCVYGYMKKCQLDRLISLRVAAYTGVAADVGQQHGLSSWKIHLHESPIHKVYHPDEIIYLSPDAEDVLTELKPSAVYVVGGIVDRSVRKGQTLEKAMASSTRVVRLPLQEYMDVRKPVLNIDSVVIALNEFSNHGDWSRAFEVAIPKRMATQRQGKRK